jgi:hypothetical protein
LSATDALTTRGADARYGASFVCALRSSLISAEAMRTAMNCALANRQVLTQF